MTDSERERIIDRRVQARLATDSGYRHAASAEAAARREDEIAAEVEMALEHEAWSRLVLGAARR